MARRLSDYDRRFITLLIAEAEHRVRQLADDAGQDSGSDREMADTRDAAGFLRHVQRAGELTSCP